LIASDKLKSSIISPLPVTAAAVKSGAGLPTKTPILFTPKIKVTQKKLLRMSIVSHSQTFN
jgi:hypothetical protein